MSRETQYIGLTNGAKAFIRAQRLQSIKSEGYYEDMGGIKIPLQTWKFPWGLRVQEVVNWMPWKGGPIVFTALKIKNKLRFKWKRVHDGSEIDPIRGTFSI